MMNKSVVACSKPKTKTEITANTNVHPNPSMNTQIHLAI
jgi:hypothetical protein